MRASALAAVLAGMLSLTGCDAERDRPAGGAETPPEAKTADRSPTPEEDPDEPSDSEMDEETEPQMDYPDQNAEVVEEMVNEGSAGWEDYEIVSETELRFLTTSGNQACYGQRYQVEETQDEVAVAIIVGQRPDGADICTQEAIFIAVPVELDEPLGDRDVVELEDPELNK